jgi:putative restriction endonuclease
VADRGTTEARQLVLQLRGTSKHDGPKHFAHSVQRGIRLADIDTELGDERTTLARLYPDGVARLWGAKPATRKDAKAWAIQNWRIGDDVIFYAKRSFIARARILHLFHNRAVAGKIWQIDDEGRTWEHITALGDVEEFAIPVPAEPVLRELGLQYPLRGLTLVSASDYTRIAPLLPAPAGRTSVRPRSSDRTAPQRMTRKRLFGAFRQLVEPSPTSADVNLPLTVLWAVGRAVGDAQPVERADDRLDLSTLLERYGTPDRKPATQEESLRRLSDSGMWEVTGVHRRWNAELDPAGFHGDVGGAKMKAGISAGGFTAEVTRLLGDPMVLGNVFNTLAGRLPVDVDRSTLLAEVGLAGYGSAAGVPESAGASPGPRQSQVMPSSARGRVLSRA